VSKTLESKSKFTSKSNKTKDSKSKRVLVVERTFAQNLSETEVLNQLKEDEERDKKKKKKKRRLHRWLKNNKRL
jgi:hypothetical protein